MIVDELSSVKIPHGKCVVITSPEQVEWLTSITHEEADVILVNSCSALTGYRKEFFAATG